MESLKRIKKTKKKKLLLLHILKPSLSSPFTVKTLILFAATLSPNQTAATLAGTGLMMATLTLVLVLHLSSASTPIQADHRILSDDEYSPLYV